MLVISPTTIKASRSPFIAYVLKWYGVVSTTSFCIKSSRSVLGSVIAMVVESFARGVRCDRPDGEFGVWMYSTEY